MGSIEAALDDLKSQKHPNYTATAKKYDVDRTTLSRRHRGVTSARGSREANSQLLSKQQSRNLVAYINKLTERGIPPSIHMVRRFAYDISQKKTGINWAARWIKSQINELQSGFLETMDLNRKKAENPYQFYRYFEQVGDIKLFKFILITGRCVKKLKNTIYNLKIFIIWMKKAF
jgi:hypothetical protein